METNICIFIMLTIFHSLQNWVKTASEVLLAPPHQLWWCRCLSPVTPQWGTGVWLSTRLCPAHTASSIRSSLWAAWWPTHRRSFRLTSPGLRLFSATAATKPRCSTNRSSTCPACRFSSTCSRHKACTPDITSRAPALRPSSAARPAESLLRLRRLRLKTVWAACRPQIHRQNTRAPTVSQRKTSSLSCTDIPKNKGKILDMQSLDYHFLLVQVGFF